MRGKSKKHPDQLDLLSWGEEVPKGKVIQARQIFQRRTNIFIRLIICGYIPPRTNAVIIDIETRRRLPPEQAQQRKRGRQVAA
ncbi:hypothetical protein ACCS75_04020 [Rhizobium ruizarguesonis]